MKKSQTDSTVLARKFASSNKGDLPFLAVIAGPTSSGKTGYSIKLAKDLKKVGIVAEVVSADSRQVYKGLNLLSGKVTKNEMSGVPHHLLDVANPKRKYSVAKYKKDAEKAIFGVLKRGHMPILVGGTGFYIDTITKGIVLPEVPPNTELRKKLENSTLEELQKLLNKLDSSRYDSIDTKNKVRLIRAIEIATALGKVPEVISKPKFAVHFIYLDLPDEDLKKRIRLRILSRMRQGMIEEAKKLVKSGVSHRRMAEIGLECRYASPLLQNKISKKEFVDQLATATWQYVKRQRTWFKKYKN